MKFCLLIENTNTTHFLHNLATFSQCEFFHWSAKNGKPMGDLCNFLVTSLQACSTRTCTDSGHQRVKKKFIRTCMYFFVLLLSCMPCWFLRLVTSPPDGLTSSYTRGATLIRMFFHWILLDSSAIAPNHLQTSHWDYSHALSALLAYLA